MRICLGRLVLVLVAAQVSAAPPGQRFVSIAFHDVVDERDAAATDAVTTARLAEFFDWLKGTGWTADLARRSVGRGARRQAAAAPGDSHHVRRRVSKSVHTRLPAAQGVSFSGGRRAGRELGGARARWHRAVRRSGGAAQSVRLVGGGARDAGVGTRRVRVAQLRPAPRHPGQPAGQPGACGDRPALRSCGRRVRGRHAVPRPDPIRSDARARFDGRPSRPPAARARVAVRAVHRTGPRGRETRGLLVRADARAGAGVDVRSRSPSIGISRRRIPAWKTWRETCGSTLGRRPRAGSCACASRRSRPRAVRRRRTPRSAA